jgi:hypothetical protein
VPLRQRQEIQSLLRKERLIDRADLQKRARGVGQSAKKNGRHEKNGAMLFVNYYAIFLSFSVDITPPRRYN